MNQITWSHLCPCHERDLDTNPAESRHRTPPRLQTCLVHPTNPQSYHNPTARTVYHKPHHTHQTRYVPHYISPTTEVSLHMSHCHSSNAATSHTYHSSHTTQGIHIPGLCVSSGAAGKGSRVQTQGNTHTCTSLHAETLTHAHTYIHANTETYKAHMH